MTRLSLVLTLCLTACLFKDTPKQNHHDTGAPADTDIDSDTDTDTDSDTDSGTDSGIDTGVIDTGETGVIDTGCEPVAWYADEDGDGYGDGVSTTSCDDPGEGFATVNGDCDDNDADINPDAVEQCDGIDNDCDCSGDTNGDGVVCGSGDDNVDEDVYSNWYEDIDGDGYGAGSVITVICDGSSGNLVANDSDCDDSAAAVSPAGTEMCDLIDNNCDGTVDEDSAADALTWYADSDSDGYGNASSTTSACSQPSGYVADSTDCDDSAAAVSPAATETCDLIDNNCDGMVDEDSAADALTWYADSDSDGYGDVGSTHAACSVPAGYTSDSSDCNDSDASISPSGTEVCDNVDNDCDGTIDESDATDVATWYYDGDSDGYGDAATTFVSCEAPAGHVSNSDDCDDTDSTIYPGATEVCDGIDNDCNGSVDGSDSADASVWFIDADSDGFGDSTFLVECDQPVGYVDDGTDCDDTDSAVNPDATEVYDDGIDNDCDGVTDTDATISCYPDVDADGYGDSTGGISESTGVCPSGYVEGDGDCDDSNDSYNPGAYDPPYDITDWDCDGAYD